MRRGRRPVALGDTEPVEFLLYLYFGKTEEDMKNFALRDLGILRTNKNASLSARFADECEALACFHFSRVLDRLNAPTDGDAREAAASILSGPVCTTDYAADLRNRAAHTCGRLLEQAEEKELAAQIYRIGASAECNERLARLLYAQGDKAESERLLQRMIEDPESDEEYLFATDFHARKFGRERMGSCTALLRAATVVTVDDAWRGNPEAGVAGALRRRGYVFVAHSVNFDYGFISREFERMERRFRFPKICTCASMRRRFLGHKSYGLGALCGTYGIELENLHRALCDARATAHLLNLINAKRDAETGEAVIAA